MKKRWQGKQKVIERYRYLVAMICLVSIVLALMISADPVAVAAAVTAIAAVGHSYLR